MPSLDMLQMESKLNSRVRISHPSYGTFAGFEQDEFALGGGAEYSNPFEHHMEEFSTRAKAGVSAVAGALGFAMDIPNMGNQASSLYQWVSTQRPSIPINFNMVRYDITKPNVTAAARVLYGAQFPRGGTMTNRADHLEDPGGYTASGGQGGTPSGTWTVRVGLYFKAELLILRSCNINLSKEKVQDGTPLSCGVQAVFEPIMVPTEDDIRGWFLIN